MPNQLHQINIHYHPSEDRILLRASTTGKLEYRVWLTRRFTALLLSILLGSLTEDGEITAASPEARKPLLDFKKQEALSKANFAEPYREDVAQYLPFGQEGILAQKIVYQRSPASLRLTITPGSGQGINLALENAMQQILKKMLEDAISLAAWNITLPPRHQTQTPLPPPLPDQGAIH